MPTRTARTAWNGTLQEGSGHVELSSSKVGTYEVSFPTRAGDPDGQTSPEELIAAAHSSCYAMSLSGILERAGNPPRTLDVSAEVTLNRDDSGLRITDVALTVRADVPGTSAEEFADAAEAAKKKCPVSRALSDDVKIALDAALASSSG